MPRGAHPAVALLALVQACSVLLDEHDLSGSNCTSHADCAPLNARAGLQASCMPYQCSGAALGADGGLSPGRCLQARRDDDSDGEVALRCGGRDCDDGDRSVRPGAAEICDGQDNDCNGVIDEGDGDAPVIEPAELTSVRTGDGIERVAYAHDDEGRALAVWIGGAGGDNSAMIAGLDGRDAAQAFALQVPREDTSDTLDPAAALATGCRAWNPSPPPAVRGHLVACQASELAIGFLGDTWLSAAVAQLGDARGQLRIGSRQRSQPPGSIMPGPAARSNSYLGIDIDTEAPSGQTAEGETTGQSRNGGVLGVARPALAALQDVRPAQALVAWLAAAPDRDECAGDAVAVEALVALLEEDHGAAWVSATTQRGGVSEGAPRVVPQVLGEAAEGVGPAVLAWPERGYLIAYGAASGRIALHFVPLAPAPPPFTPCDPLACDPDVPRAMPALAQTRSAELEASAADANGVALAGAARDGGFDLGIAWREGCGPGGERIVFRRIEVRVDAGTGLAIANATDALALDGPGDYGPPSIVHVESGFERPVTPEDAHELGGWAIAYRDDGERRMVVRRIGERATTLLDHDAIALGTDVAEASGDLVTRPWLYREQRARVRFAYFDGNAAVVAGRFSCEPRSASRP